MMSHPIIVDHVLVHSLVPVAEKLRWEVGEGIYTLLLYQAFYSLFDDFITDDAVYRDTDESWHWELKFNYPGSFNAFMKEVAPQIAQEMERLAEKYQLKEGGIQISRHREEIYSDPDTHFIYLERFEQLVNQTKQKIREHVPFVEILEGLAEKRYRIGRALLHEGALSGELRRDKIVDVKRINPNIRTPLLEPSYAKFAKRKLKEDEIVIEQQGLILSQIHYVQDNEEFEKLSPSEQLSGRSITHTERKVFDEALDILFKKFDEWKKDQNAERAGEVIWWLAQVAPYIRGNGAIVEVMTLALLENKKFKENVWIDFEAIFEPDSIQFSRRLAGGEYVE